MHRKCARCGGRNSSTSDNKCISCNITLAKGNQDLKRLATVMRKTRNVSIIITDKKEK
jgi:ribosomal protein L37E